MTTKLILELLINKSPTATRKEDYSISKWEDYYIEEKSNGSFSLNFLVHPNLGFTQENQEVEKIVVDFPSKERAKKVAEYFSHAWEMGSSPVIKERRENS